MSGIKPSCKVPLAPRHMTGASDVIHWTGVDRQSNKAAGEVISPAKITAPSGLKMRQQELGLGSETNSGSKLLSRRSQTKH